MLAQTFGTVQSPADILSLVELAFDVELDPDDDSNMIFEDETELFSSCLSFECRLRYPILREIDATAFVFDWMPGYYRFDVYDLASDEEEPIASGSCVRALVLG